MRSSSLVRAVALFVSIVASHARSAAQASSTTHAHAISITISAVPAIDGIAQLHAEFIGAPKVGFAAIVGGGSVEGYQGYSVGYERGPFPLFLAGMQGHYYLLGDFEEGMQIGAQMLVKLTSRDAIHSNYYRDGNGVELVPYLGYKIIIGPGITFNAQAGLGTILNKTFFTTGYTETPGQGTTRDGYYDYQYYLQPLLHLNFGWSF